MRAHNHKVGQGAGKADVRQCLRGVQPRHSGAIHARRRLLGVNIHIGEKGDAQAAHVYEQRIMRRQNVLSRPHRLNARRAQTLQTIEQGFRAPIVGVIIGLRSHVEARGI